MGLLGRPRISAPNSPPRRRRGWFGPVGSGKGRLPVSHPCPEPCERGKPLTTFTAEASSALGGPGWLVRRRAEAWERFAATSVPTEAEEVWRYSGIDGFDLDAYAPAPLATSSESTVAVARRLADSLGPRAGLVVTRNGTIEAIEMEGSAPEALSVTNTSTA